MMVVSSCFNFKENKRGNDERMDKRWERKLEKGIQEYERKKEIIVPHQIS
jgi:hypothetical protein